ncbi:acyl dehydratase [Thalassotalea sp. HSM 43]|uniref:MaoC/PaaZ C-terminal domain-containing protein n=1 Tax=Thalassotalea sp. HSM 43 TaxID=2552945 RepID=UPI0010814C74|nr:MaoC/PaaZ C-terminal domain-containing protein [Thalassotalea sp. HSM 43]QBY05479.1 acyl dehydratase [Thalassotalea sp. HSM 43]
MSASTTIDWSTSKTLTDVSIGDLLPAIDIDITLQRLVMEAAANRDLSLIHHDKSVAQATGAPDAYANTFFLYGMIERLVRQWGGVNIFIRKIGPLRMNSFNCVGDSLSFNGKVKDINVDEKTVTLSTWVANADKVSVTADVKVIFAS